MRTKKLLNSIAFVLLIALAPLASAGLSCNITKAFDRDEIKNDPEFWAEFAKLSEKGELNDNAVQDLLKKRSVDIRGDIRGDKPVVSPQSQKTLDDRRVAAPRYSLDKHAQKDLAALPARLRPELDEVLEIIAKGKPGLKEFRDRPGRWNFKQFKGDTIKTVRLNNGYRVAFDVFENGTIQVVGINKMVGH